MKAGMLRHRVTIREPIETQNEYGEPEVRWQIIAEEWAAIEPLRGAEYFTARQEYGEVDFRIRMRYLSGVNAKMKAVHGSDEYLIEAPLDIMTRNRELHLMATKITL